MDPMTEFSSRPKTSEAGATSTKMSGGGAGRPVPIQIAKLANTLATEADHFAAVAESEDHLDLAESLHTASYHLFWHAKKRAHQMPASASEAKLQNSFAEIRTQYDRLAREGLSERATSWQAVIAWRNIEACFSKLSSALGHS